MERMIEVWEDNGGGVYLWDAECNVGFDVTSMIDHGTGVADLVAVLNEDTYGWTVPVIEYVPDGCPIAQATEGKIILFVNEMGNAGKKYFRLEE